MEIKKCVHEECPYKGCHYHKEYNGEELNVLLELIIPKINEEMESCMAYLDI